MKKDRPNQCTITVHSEQQVSWGDQAWYQYH